MQYTLTLTDQADDDSYQAILAPLVAYNISKAGHSGTKPIVVLLRDDSQRGLGGLWGHTGYGWLFIQLLLVPESHRGQGIGTRLVEIAETEALARKCHGVWLDTFEFQARGFYEKLGYVRFAELNDYPLGFSRYFLKKALASSA